MNVEHLTKSAKRFHKATTVLASHIMGQTVTEININNLSLPIVARQDDKIWIVSPRGILGDTDFITPYVVNAAFSLELHLKLLHLLEADTWAKEHDLGRLYRCLSKTSRDHIDQSVVDSASNGSDVKRMLKQLRNYGVKIKWKALPLIENSNKAFVNWRYAFDSVPGSFSGYSQLQAGIHTRIKTLI